MENRGKLIMGEIVLGEVIKELKARAEFGKKKYGTYLKTNNGRNALRDAIEEAMDLVMYLKQLEMEIGEEEIKEGGM